jgi:hypothetical protein
MWSCTGGVKRGWHVRHGPGQVPQGAGRSAVPCAYLPPVLALSLSYFLCRLRVTRRETVAILRQALVPQVLLHPAASALSQAARPLSHQTPPRRTAGDGLPVKHRACAPLMLGYVLLQRAASERWLPRTAAHACCTSAHRHRRGGPAPLTGCVVGVHAGLTGCAT